MPDLTTLQHDLPAIVRPDEPIGAFLYFVVFATLAALLSRGLRTAVHVALSKERHVDRTAISFLQQIATVLIWVMMVILYAHLIPQLRALGTALLAGAGVASVVIGLAAQSTLGNLVAGVSMTIYRPFRLGDTLQVATPTGTEIGAVEHISLGYTTLRVQDGRFVVLPNSLAASQVTLNLSPGIVRGSLSINIRLNRDSDLDAARRLACAAAAELVGDAAVSGCHLTRIDATEAQLELRFQPAADGSREAQRASVMMRLNQRFTDAAKDAPSSQRPTFA